MNPWPIVASLIFALLTFIGGYAKGSMDNEAVHIARERDGLLAYAEQIKKGVEQHDKNQAVINDLRTELGRVRITIPVCGEASYQSGAGGVLSKRVSQIFEDFRAEVEGLVYRCDELNNAAIRSNTLKEAL